MRTHVVWLGLCTLAVGAGLTTSSMAAPAPTEVRVSDVRPLMDGPAHATPLPPPSADPAPSASAAGSMDDFWDWWFRTFPRRPRPGPVVPTVTTIPVRPSPTPAPAPEEWSADYTNQRLARSVNMCGHLEFADGRAPAEELFRLAASAGFTGVRLCVTWPHHQKASSPWTVDATYFAEVDAAIARARTHGLVVVLDAHYDDALNAQPAAHRERFLATWRQIAERYADRGPELVFEVLNEPNGALDASWNSLFADALAVIRRSNPTRIVIASTNDWGHAASLPQLRLPADNRLILSVHHYAPFGFTHQGADWMDDPPPLGRTWPSHANVMPVNHWELWDADSIYQKVTGTPQGLAFESRQPWGSIILARQVPTRATSVTFTVDTAQELVVSCHVDPQKEVDGTAVTARAGVPVTVPVTACANGATGPIQRVSLMPNPDKQQPGFTLTDIRLATDHGDLPLLGDERADAASGIRYAAEWGADHGIPVFMGEFGVYDKADHASRVRWTRAMREEAEAHGVSWAVWNFSGDPFGIHDDSGWDVDLLGALLPDSGELG